MNIKKHKVKKYRIVLNSKFQSGEKRYANKFHHTNESNNIKDANKILEFNSREEAQEHIINHPSSLILRNYVIEEFEKEVSFWQFLRQLFCRHNYKSHYCRLGLNVSDECMKCGKQIYFNN